MLSIVTPSEIEDPWYTGELSADEPRTGTVKGSQRAAVPDGLDWPAVTIGRPQCWDLTELAVARDQQLPPEMRLLLDASDFFLLQLACSFRPRQGTEVDWARFEVSLRTGGTGQQPVAFDMYPREVTTRIDRDVKLSISPSLKFAGIEAGVGSLSTDIAMTRVEPSVIAYGLMESEPAWDYTAHAQAPLVGSRFGYIIVQRRKGAAAMTAVLRIVARVKAAGGIFRASLRTESGERLTVPVCAG